MIIMFKINKLNTYLIKIILTYENIYVIIQPIIILGIAQMVARYLGVVEAVGSNPATQTKSQLHASVVGIFYFIK